MAHGHVSWPPGSGRAATRPLLGHVAALTRAPRAQTRSAGAYGAIQVSEEDAYAYAVRAAREEGIFVGPSSRAALAASRIGALR
jgi:threonine synthase